MRVGYVGVLRTAITSEASFMAPRAFEASFLWSSDIVTGILRLKRSQDFESRKDTPRNQRFKEFVYEGRPSPLTVMYPYFIYDTVV
jgi:hypothetical protein